MLKKVKNSQQWNQIGKQKRLLDLFYVHKTIFSMCKRVFASEPQHMHHTCPCGPSTKLLLYTLSRPTFPFTASKSDWKLLIIMQVSIQTGCPSSCASLSDRASGSKTPKIPHFHSTSEAKRSECVGLRACVKHGHVVQSKYC